MTGKAALIVVHDYSQHLTDRIPALEKRYGERFSRIHHLVPAHKGFAPVANEIAPNVIHVRGKPYRFQGYIAQGLRDYFCEDCTHYFFIHYDVMLNPSINEDNFREYLKLDEEGAAFFPEFYALHRTLEWEHTPVAFAFEGNIETLPSYPQALEKFAAHGLEIKPLSFHESLLPRVYFAPPPPPRKSVLSKIVSPLRYLKTVLRRLKRLLNWPAGKKKLAYPLVGGFAGMAVVPATDIKQFCRHCKTFAEHNLPASIALPTALVLSCKKINTSKNIREWVMREKLT